MIVFLMELRLAYINSEPEARDENVQSLRWWCGFGLILGCLLIFIFRGLSFWDVYLENNVPELSCKTALVHDPDFSWMGQACHAALTGSSTLLLLGLFLQPPFFLMLMLRLALLQWPRRGPARTVARWLAVVVALITASAGLFSVDAATAMQLPWAAHILRWNDEQGVIFFFFFGALPELVMLAALGEEVHTTRFTKFGSVPWLLRVPLNEVSIGAELGEGAFSRVYAGSWRGGAVALKRLKTEGLIVRHGVHGIPGVPGVHGMQAHRPRGSGAAAVAAAPADAAAAYAAQAQLARTARAAHVAHVARCVAALERLEIELETEAAMLCKTALRHPNVLRFIGLVVGEAGESLLMTELCQLGSLDTLLQQGPDEPPPPPHSAAAAAAAAHYGEDKQPPHASSQLLPLPWWRRLRLAQQLASGVMHLHHQRPPILHRDLKPQNCLLDERFNLKICDFGLSRTLARVAQSPPGDASAADSPRSPPPWSRSPPWSPSSPPLFSPLLARLTPTLGPSRSGTCSSGGTATPPPVGSSTTDSTERLAAAANAANASAAAERNATAASSPLPTPLRASRAGEGGEAAAASSAPPASAPPVPTSATAPLLGRVAAAAADAASAVGAAGVGGWESGDDGGISPRQSLPVPGCPSAARLSTSGATDGFALDDDGATPTPGATPGASGAASTSVSVTASCSSCRVPLLSDAAQHDASPPLPLPLPGGRPGSSADELAVAAGRRSADRLSLDFDAGLVSPRMTTNCGTARWMAPECMALPSAGDDVGGQAEYTLSADVYSTGLLLWAIAARRYPFAELQHTAELMRAVKSGVRPPRLPAERCPAGWADLCEMAWEDTPAYRPSIARVYEVLMAMRTDGMPTDVTR